MYFAQICSWLPKPGGTTFAQKTSFSDFPKALVEYFQSKKLLIPSPPPHLMGSRQGGEGLKQHGKREGGPSVKRIGTHPTRFASSFPGLKQRNGRRRKGGGKRTDGKKNNPSPPFSYSFSYSLSLSLSIPGRKEGSGPSSSLSSSSSSSFPSISPSSSL